MGTSLASVTQLANFLQVELASNDPSAQLYLDIASGMVRAYLKQTITQVRADVVEVDPINGAYVTLDELPVTDVASVEILNADGEWTLADPSTYTVSKRLGIIAGKPGCGVFWPPQPASWRVTYTHGYATVPDSLVGVVLGVAGRGYASPVGIELERIGGYQVKYAMESAGFSALEKIALDSYKVATIA